MRPGKNFGALSGALSILAIIAMAPADAAGAYMPASSTSSSAAPLSIVAQSNSMIWNAVAIDGPRIFVAGPRWTGSNGPSVALIDRSGAPRPYPDAAWNAWQPGMDAATHFVDVNAIHRDDHGGLWIIDTGTPSFGGDPLPGGAKAVRIDLKTNRIDRIYHFDSKIALPGSYVDDIRFHGNHAYLTDAGRAGLIVLDLKSGVARRVLDGHRSVTAPNDRPIRVDGTVLLAPDDKPLKVNSDPLEVSPNGEYLYFASLHGPWSSVPTRLLDDPSVHAADLAAAVRDWADLPPVGGTAMAPDGTLYFTDLATHALMKRTAKGTITTLLRDIRLHWVDAPAIQDGWIFLPVPQIDRTALFHHGVSKIEWPISLYRTQIEKPQQQEKK